MMAIPHVLGQQSIRAFSAAMWIDGLVSSRAITDQELLGEQ
jgi:hypothetical protein